MAPVPIYARVRPLTGKYTQKEDNEPMLEVEWGSGGEISHKTDKSSRCAFSHIFDPDSTNKQVFEKVVRPMCEMVLKGYNALIFAYGQSGTGKTFTLQGKENLKLKGMIQHALELYMDNEVDKLTLQVVEVYGTKPQKIQIFDVLSTLELDWSKKKPVPLDLKKITKENITRENIFSVATRGFANSHWAPTGKNPESSRGHTVFLIGVSKNDAQSHHLVIDLAGSEGATALTPEFCKTVTPDVVKQRGMEGGVINSGLLQLAQIFEEIRKKGQLNRTQGCGLRKVIHGFVNKQTAMAALFMLSCSTVPSDVTSSANTLKFANRIGKLKLKPVKVERKRSSKKIQEEMQALLDAKTEELKTVKEKLAKLEEEFGDDPNFTNIVEGGENASDESESELSKDSPRKKTKKKQKKAKPVFPKSQSVNALSFRRLEEIRQQVNAARKYASRESNPLEPLEWAGDAQLNNKLGLLSKNLYEACFALGPPVVTSIPTKLKRDASMEYLPEDDYLERTQRRITEWKSHFQHERQLKTTAVENNRELKKAHQEGLMKIEKLTKNIIILERNVKRLRTAADKKTSKKSKSSKNDEKTDKLKAENEHLMKMCKQQTEMTRKMLEHMRSMKEAFAKWREENCPDGPPLSL